MATQKQTAALNQLRAEKRAKSKAAAAHVESTQPDPAAASIEELVAGLALPNPARVVVGVIISLFASFSVGYGIGMLMSYALAGISLLVGSALLSFVLSVFVWIVGIWAAFNAGAYVGSKVFASVVMPEGLASRSYESVAQASVSAKNTVVGWFKPRAKIVDVSNGAYVA